MKVYIRTLWNDGARPLWINEDQRDGLRRYLNTEGFYVLTGTGDSLDVYAIDYTEPADIKMAKEILEKFRKIWHTQVTRRSKK